MAVTEKQRRGMEESRALVKQLLRVLDESPAADASKMLAMSEAMSTVVVAMSLGSTDEQFQRGVDLVQRSFADIAGGFRRVYKNDPEGCRQAVRGGSGGY
jgi:hypothetical protein